jgi:hypothetical protein
MRTWCIHDKSVFILEHHIDITVVCEVFSNDYPDKEVLSKSAVHRM